MFAYVIYGFFTGTEQVMKSPRHSEYHALTTLAVKMERDREFKEAGRLWEQARFLARKSVNMEYCSNRAEFCKKSKFTR